MVALSLLLPLLLLPQAAKPPKPVTKPISDRCRFVRAFQSGNSLVGVYLEPSDAYSVKNTASNDLDMFNTASKFWVDDNNNGKEDAGESWFANRAFRVGDKMFRATEISEDGRKVVFAPVAGAPMGLVTGRSAPSFSYLRLNGGPVKSADFKGKYLLLHFFSYSCHACVNDWAVVRTLQGKLGEKKLAVLLVSVDRSLKGAQAEEVVQDILTENGVTWPTAIDEKGWAGVEARFNVSAYGFALIGPDGNTLGVNLASRDIERLIAKPRS